MLENIPRDTQFLMFERGELDTAEQLAAPDYLWVIERAGVAAVRPAARRDERVRLADERAR